MSVVTSATLPLPLPEPGACDQLVEKETLRPVYRCSGNMQTPPRMGGDSYGTTALLKDAPRTGAKGNSPVGRTLRTAPGCALGRRNGQTCTSMLIHRL